MGLRSTSQLEKMVRQCSRSISTSAIRPCEYIVRSASAPTIRPPGGFGHYTLDKAAKFEHRTFMVDGVTGEKLHYNELVDRSQRWGGMLQKSRLPTGDLPTVALFMGNNLEFPSLYCGCLASGSVVSPMNPSYTAGEAAYQLEDSGAHMVVADAAREATATKALQMLQKKGVPVPQLLVVGQSQLGHSDLSTLLRDASQPFATPVEVSEEAVAVLPYSSGTTGRPKGVMTQHKALSLSTEMLNSPDYVDPASMDNQVTMSILPYYHIYGFIVLSLTVARGGTLVNYSGFDKDHVIRGMREHRPTFFPTVPPILKFLIASKEVTREDLQSLTMVGCGAAPVSKSSVEQFQSKVGKDLFFAEGYGMTEVLVTSYTPFINQRIGFCGQLLPNVSAKVIDTSTGESLPANTKGELCVKTPCMMKGYHNNPKATEETIDSEGWLHTGDIAYYDNHNFFSIVDRIKELIKVKGLQVSPSELEDVLLSHPAIADAGVVGVPHERAGEVPRAYLIKGSGKSVTEEEVEEYMKEHLSDHKQLVGGIKFVSELPKNPSGKLLRRVLKEQAMDE